MLTFKNSIFLLSFSVIWYQTSRNSIVKMMTWFFVDNSLTVKKYTITLAMIINSVIKLENIIRV